jgi:hypothetical protein
MVVTVRLAAVGLLAGVLVSAASEKPERWLDPRCEALSLFKQGPFVRLPRGVLMAVDGNATWTSADDGRTWAGPRPVYRGSGPAAPGVPNESACLFRSRESVLLVVWRDRLRLAWDAGKGEPGPEARGDVWCIRSTDDGRTWVDRRRIFAGVCGHPPRDIVQAKAGRIVVPVQFYLRDPGRNAACTLSSADGGQTWERSNIIDLGGHGQQDGALEPTLVELKNGTLWMLLRTSLDRFWEAYSGDGGLSWRVIKPSAIEASSSPGYLTRLTSGTLALLWNRLYPAGTTSYARRGEPYSKVPASWHREELSVAFSEDEGATWTAPITVAREPGAWLSYPYLFEPTPGVLWIFTRQGDVQVRAREKQLLGDR